MALTTAVVAAYKASRERIESTSWDDRSADWKWISREKRQLQNVLQRDHHLLRQESGHTAVIMIHFYLQHLCGNHNLEIVGYASLTQQSILETDATQGQVTFKRIV